MSRIFALLILAVNAWCDVHIRYTNDLYGRYVPFDMDGDCYPSQKQLPPLRAPERLELSNSEEQEEQNDADQEVEDTIRWAQDCIGGVGRQSSMLRFAEVPQNVSYLSISAGNVLNQGPWEVAVGYDAAAVAASVYDVMGLGPQELRRGDKFLRDYLMNVHSVRNKTVLACNLKSDLLSDIVGTWSVVSTACIGAGCGQDEVGVVGFVDPESVRHKLGFVDPSFQLSNLSCVMEGVKQLKNSTKSVVAVGSIGSLERLESSGLLDIQLDAIVLSELPKLNKTFLKQHGYKFNNHATFILAADTFGTSVGDFNLTSKNVTTFKMDSKAKNDTKIINKITTLQQEVDDFFETPVNVLNPLRSADCNCRECSIGDILADAMLVGGFYDRLLGANRTDHPNPIAVWPGMYIWNTTIARGNTTVRELYGSLPGGDTYGGISQVALATANGDTVRSLFAHAVDDMTPNGWSATFLQVSGVKVTYDLDLAPSKRAKYLMNLCFRCSPQQYYAVSPSVNYTILLPAFMLVADSPWSEIIKDFHSVSIAEFEARDVVAALARHFRFVRSPVGGRIDFTHWIPGQPEPPDTFIAVLVTVVVCMVVFGLALLGFRVWSHRQTDGGPMLRLIN